MQVVFESRDPEGARLRDLARAARARVRLLHCGRGRRRPAALGAPQ